MSPPSTGEVPLVLVTDPDDADFAEVHVPGTVAGDRYLFLLDTGARLSQVVDDALTSALPVAGRHRSSGILAGQDPDLVLMPDLTIGPVRREGLVVCRAPAGSTHARNLLGMDFLREHRCRFSFTRQTLTLDAACRGWTTYDLHTDDAGHAYLPVGLPGVRVRAVWDTGASVTVVDTRLVERRPELFAPGPPSRGTDVTGAEVEAPTYLMAGSVIGGVGFGPHRVAATDLSRIQVRAEPMDLVLGWTTIRQADWLFDYPAARWGLTARPGRASGADRGR